MINRRTFLRVLGGAVLAGFGGAAYGIGVESFRHIVTRYRVTPQGWPRDLPMKIALVADIHACEPWMPVQRIDQIVQQTNTLGADLVLLLGDYTRGRVPATAEVPDDDWARALSGLRAPLGVHAVMGNHDWRNDRAAAYRGGEPTRARLALERHGITVYSNEAVQLRHRGRPFWLAGLEDQSVWFRNKITKKWRKLNDLPGTLAHITDDAPVILMAHQPDVFNRVPSHVALTVAGHTHGGQVRAFGRSVWVPSKFGNRYAYGHMTEKGANGIPRDLVVSGGLGCSGLPIRLGMPPEIVLVELGGA